MKKYFQAKVMDNQPEKAGSDAFFLDLKMPDDVSHWESLGPIISLEAFQGCAPRPFSIMNIDQDIITLLIKKRGPNTIAYSELKPGQEIMVFGPQGLLIPYSPDVQKFTLMAGGIGIPAVYPLAKKLLYLGKNVSVILGGKNLAQIYAFDHFDRLGIPVEIIAEEGFARQGQVTDILEEKLKYDQSESQVIACGPWGMLKKTHEICQAYSNSCVVIVEERMACSRGSCQGCPVPCVEERNGEKFYYCKSLCTDGPGFISSEIDWNSLASESPAKQPIIKAEEKQLSRTGDETINLSSDLGRLTLSLPGIGASGCFDANDMHRVNISEMGAVAIKGPTFEEWPGNKSSRIGEWAGGLINSIGLAKSGLETVKEKLPTWQEWEMPIIANISAGNARQYASLAERLNDIAGISAIEINVSCPNKEEHGMAFGTSPKETAKVVRAVREKTDLPLITKLTPNDCSIGPVAKAAEEEGSDMISCINTVLVMVVDVLTRRPLIGNNSGGFSGPPILPIGVRKTWEVCQAVKIPVIGGGGIASGDDAFQYILVGASAFFIGTSSFNDPEIFSKVNVRLTELLNIHGFTSLGQARGKVMLN